MSHPRNGTGRHGEWFTPPSILRIATAALKHYELPPWDLDPAGHPDSSASKMASKVFTPAENGLERSWHGRVFCHPPMGNYCQTARAFWRKAAEELLYERAKVVLFLLYRGDYLGELLDEVRSRYGIFPYCGFSSVRPAHVPNSGQSTATKPAYHNALVYMAPKPWKLAHGKQFYDAIEDAEGWVKL